MWQFVLNIFLPLFILISISTNSNNIKPSETDKGFHVVTPLLYWPYEIDKFLSNIKEQNSVWDILHEIDVSYIIHPKFTSPKTKGAQYRIAKSV